MFCTSHLFFACLCLPQRLKPQTAAGAAVFPFSSFFIFPQIFRNIQAVSYSIYLQCLKDPILYRAKKPRLSRSFGPIFLSIFRR